MEKFRDIFEVIWEYDKTTRGIRKPYDNNVQKWLFRIMVIFFILAILAALATHFKPLQGAAKAASLFFVVISQLSGFAYNISMIFLGIKTLISPTKEFMEPASERAEHDFRLAEILSRFDKDQLQFAKNKLEQEALHMRGRIAFLVGAIEKVGILPIVVTTIISFHNFSADKENQLFDVDWLMYGLLGLYVVFLPVSFFVHKIERYTLSLETAIALKGTREELANPATAGHTASKAQTLNP